MKDSLACKVRFLWQDAVSIEQCLNKSSAVLLYDLIIQVSLNCLKEEQDWELIVFEALQEQATVKFRLCKDAQDLHTIRSEFRLLCQWAIDMLLHETY